MLIDHQAADTTRKAIATWADAARRVGVDRHGKTIGPLSNTPDHLALYEQHVDPNRRLEPPAPVDVNTIERQLLDDLEARVAERRALAAQTLDVLRCADAL